MKKIWIFLIGLCLFIGMYFLFTNYFIEKKIDFFEGNVTVNNLYVYGTHLNLEGKISIEGNYQLVLYNNEFLELNINQDKNYFSLSQYLNGGIDLEKLSRGKYYLFLSTKDTNNDNGEYKYYSINNNSKYKETIYYTFSNINNKITIGTDKYYSTIYIDVRENKEKDKEIYDIVIDPGHGGLDSGAINGEYWESNFTMDISNKVKNILNDKGIKVRLTRTVDSLKADELLQEYGPDGRAVIPHNVKAKYLFSIHINKHSNKKVNGLEIYGAKNINYDFAKNLVTNLKDKLNINISNNKNNLVYDGIYSRNFTENEILKSKKEFLDKNMKPYNITTNSNYYYIIRETGGFMTGAYVDDRNNKVLGNPYYDSNVGVESYLLELGFISNNKDLKNLINNSDKFAEAIAETIISNIIV